MTPEQLLVERSGAVAVVTVNRPKVLNALNAATVAELRQVVDALTADDAIRAVVLTGAGDRAFIAGADIAELATLSPVSAQALARRGQALCDALERMGKPVIAAVNGYALGGGCEIAMACTVRLAADTARIGQPEIGLGLLPGYGGTQRLPRLVGSGRALELMLTGDPIAASEAWRIGLVNRVVAPGDLAAEARALADRLASQAPVAVRAILDAVREGTQMSLAGGCEQEAALFGVAAATDDWREGTRAFLEKRRPTFTGA
jgi:enoyl-CoA hydratase